MNPDRRWGTSGQTAGSSPAPGGCAFADRCSSVMHRCRVAKPPLYAEPNGQAARCFLSGERPTISDERVARNLAGEIFAEAS